ncbi:MAG: hypothetical protein BWY86_01241 [Candidatus Aminicenantes bacterium ADurb.Bin508]|nr:MAG: hypothetical protein BWY86_01241 [Candidatus Aminicenantes bacterium ADurb.Bin508]
MVFDDAIDKGEAQPRPLPIRFGREERLEDSRLDLLAHPYAGVGHREHHIAPPLLNTLSQNDLSGLEDQLSPLRHGVTGVDAEVQNHLLELSGVPFDDGVVPPVLNNDFYPLVEGLAENLHRLLDDVQKVHGPDIVLSPSGEGQKLACQLRRSFRALLDGFDVGEEGVFPLDLQLHQGGIPEDTAQDVVEIVGDSPGQEADALHLLLLKELALHPLLLGHVPDHPPKVEGFPLGVRFGFHRSQNVQPLPVPALQREGVVFHRLPAQDPFQESLLLLLLEEEPKVRRSHLFPAGTTQKLEPRRVDV